MFLITAALVFAEDVTVSSNIDGAAIFVNGVDTGEVTPATLTGIAPGTVKVSVKSRCATGEASFKVIAGAPQKVSILAIDAGGTITVKPTPVEAVVLIDGAPHPGKVGKPIPLDCGPHTVEASLDGYAPVTERLELEMGQALVLPLTLQKGGLGTLDLTVQPRTAVMTLDGKEVGTDAVTLPSVANGTHVLSAELAGYQTATQEVVIETGDVQGWSFVLQRNGSKTKSVATQVSGPKREPAAVAEAEEASEDEGGDVPYYLRDDKESAKKKEAEEKARKEAEAKAKQEADAKAKREAEAEAQALADAEAKTATSRSSGSSSSAASKEDEDLDEDLDEASDVPYYLRDDKKATKAEKPESTSKSSTGTSSGSSSSGKASSTSSKSTDTASKSSSSGSTSKSGTSASSAKKSGSGKDVAGVVLGVAGLGGGGAATYFYLQASSAHKNFLTKQEAAKAEEDEEKRAELRADANSYYENVVQPRALLFYATTGGSALLLGTGIILIAVDAPVMPVIVPGGALLQWSGRF